MTEQEFDDLWNSYSLDTEYSQFLYDKAIKEYEGNDSHTAGLHGVIAAYKEKNT